jgi:putative ABC transport system substrate-binding protein
MELKPINLLDVSETERTIAAFARSPNGGLIVTVGGTAFNRDLIIALAAKHRLPAVYPYRYFASAGSRMSYGPDTIEQHRRAAGYVDRILKGEKPADLPVQAPTKYELVINLKTAKALGLSVPPSVLARVDVVKRTWRLHCEMSAYASKANWTSIQLMVNSPRVLRCRRTVGTKEEARAA